MLRFPRAYWVVAAVAVALSLPSVTATFYADDLQMMVRLDGIAPAPIPGPFHLYTFASGVAGERHLLVDRGPLPWWTIDGLRLSFFRPLSGALLTIEHALSGRSPLLYHLDSIAWYAAACVAAAMLLRRLLPEREAAMAALLFAASPAHWMLGAWPSARHVAVSGVFGIAAIALHVRAREKRDRRAEIAAIACTAVALAGGETALGVFAYVGAYELFGRREAIALRVRSLLPWGALIFVYAVAYVALGYGVRGSGAYIDPIASPGVYLAALPSRLAVFAEAALVCVPSEASMLVPHAAPILALLGVAATVALALLLRRALTRLDAPYGATFRWLLIGAVLATLPGIAGIPGDRILFMPNLGVAAALSVVILHAFKRGGALFALIHVVLAPLVFVVCCARYASSSHVAAAAVSTAEIPARARVFGIGLSDPLLGMYLAPSLLFARDAATRPSEVSMLTISPHDHRVTRTGDRSLEIAIDGGALLDGAFEYVVRPPSAPLRTGDVVTFGTSTVRILADDGGKPTRFEVTFDRSLDDPSMVLLVWRGGALRALSLPPAGVEVRVAHEVGPMGI